MNLPDKIAKYLSKQSNNKWEIQFKGSRLFNNIVVIPAKDEFTYLKHLFHSIVLNDKNYLSNTFIVIVINNTRGDDSRIINENHKTIDYLFNEMSDKKSILNIGIVDASSKGKELPLKSGGVGLARKIGMDLALKHFDFNDERTNVLISLDADCTVSRNYLKSVIDYFNTYNINAAVVDFEHIYPEEPQLKAAIINYEIFLRYYVLALKYADSPFAHHSVGSTIVCDDLSYIKVGGMNKRKAGEDFYFLEKLAKITDIKFIHSAKVYPSARESSRVPFGTGASIKRYLYNNQDEYLLYSPKIFEILKLWLYNYYNTKFHVENINSLLKNAEKISVELNKFLIHNNFQNDWKNILGNSKSDLQINKQKNMWMDGFRTLKLVHHLRDESYPNISMFLAVNKLFEKLKINPSFVTEDRIPSIDIQMKYLEFLRKHSAS